MTEVSVTEQRIAVLLGAGASVDAGLPMSTELTKLLVEKLGEQLIYDRPVLDALHFVCSAMIGHRGSTGESPYTGINVEKMFSAVRLLSTRADHEAAPFVANWLPRVESVDAHPVEPLDGEIIASITSALTGTQGSRTSLTHLISRIASAAGRPGDGSVYLKLENKLLPAACQVLAKHKDVSYLSPLANLARNQKNGLDIATLNYDMTLEIMCDQAGITVETGMDKWIPGHPIAFDEGTKQHIRLFKLHGSINWTYRMNTPEPTKTERLIRTLAVTKTDPLNNQAPAIVIGDREKLGGDGPTLALMREFEQRLDKAERLVVVGYSFADNHINAVIRNWINTNTRRSLTVVDPFWPRVPVGFQADLVNGLISSYGVTESLPPRMNVIRKNASQGLEEALAQGPDSSPDTDLWLRIVDSGANPLVLEVRNMGPDVESVCIYAGDSNDESRTIRGLVQRHSGGETHQVLKLGDLQRGQVLQAELSLRRPAEPGTEDIALSCETSTGLRHHIYDVRLQTGHVTLRS